MTLKTGIAKCTGVFGSDRTLWTSLRYLLPRSLRGQFTLALVALALLILTAGAVAIYAFHTATTAGRQLEGEQLEQMRDAQDLVEHALIIARVAYQMLTIDADDAAPANESDMLSQMDSLDRVVARLAAESDDVAVLDLHQSSQMFRNTASIAFQLRESTRSVEAAFRGALADRVARLQAVSTPAILKVVALLYRLQSASREEEVNELRTEFSQLAATVRPLPDVLRGEVNGVQDFLSGKAGVAAEDLFTLRLRFIKEAAEMRRFREELHRLAEAMTSAARGLSTSFTREYRNAAQALANTSERNQRWVMGLLAGSVVFAWLIIRVLLKRHVFERLNQFSKYLRIGEFNDAQSAMPVGRTDEIGDMARAVEPFLKDRQQLALTRASLDEERKRLAAIIDHTADGIVVLQNNLVQQINPAAERLFRVLAENIVGRHVSTLMTSADIHAATSFVTCDALARTPDGKTFPIEVSRSEVETRDGALVILVVRDATLRKQAEQQLTSARDAAIAAQRAQAAFLANMSHELRTPLNAILGYAQILKRDKNFGDRQVAGLNTIEQSGEHLLMLINDILDLSKIEAGKIEFYIETLSLRDFLRAIAETIGVKAEEKNVVFTFELAPDLPQVVQTDEKRLRQVLLNLLVNAVKFTDLGEVSLHVTTLSQGDGRASLHFEIRDTGIGIAQDQLEPIFQPFEQAGNPDRRYGGTGLGLAISRQLIRLMGSDIHVESEKGQGSRFWFDLNLIVGGSVVAVPMERNAIGYQGPRRKVLIVDDVAGNRAMVADLLVSVGFDAFEAENGEVGLAQAQACRPDLVLMDIVMPVMDGLEATRRLRQLPEFREVPIIALSAGALQSDLDRSIAVGANAFHTKPFDANRLLAQIGSLLHLSWIYEEEEAGLYDAVSEQLVPPPPAEMAALYKLALTGNMREIRNRAAHVASLDERYQPFADKLSVLAERYQSEAIVNLIEEYL